MASETGGAAAGAPAWEPLAASSTGPFDPDAGLADLSRQALAELGREYLLLGHLLDRVGMPLVVERFGGEAQGRLAIDEWMAASPVYSKRMQRALRFEGDDVATVFKNLQLDIGAPPQFMDFQFRLDGPRYGEFWLDHCGALMDVEPWGETAVRRMCHDIEDPTFDATAAATNPHMVMRPIHRPPRTPADRHPHCRWKVFLDEDATVADPHIDLDVVASSLVAAVGLVLPDGGERTDSGGLPDYSGPFDPDFQLEDLAHRALLIVAQEAAVQAHLLVRSFLLAVDRHFGPEAAATIGRRQWTGSASVDAHRLRRALGLEHRDDIDAVARVVQLHPHFLPRTYVDLGLEVTGERSARLTLGPSPAFAERDDHSWFSGLGGAPHPALDAMVGAVNPRARCVPVDGPTSGHLAWDIVIDPAVDPRPDPPELGLARISLGADFELTRRRPLGVPVSIEPGGR